MKISCPNCAAAYELDDSRVPPTGLSIKCPKCKNPFTVHRAKGDAAKPAAKTAVPLPGQAESVAAPSRPAAKASPAMAPPGSAVPLPGLSNDRDDAPESSALPDLDSPAEAGSSLPDLDEGATV